MRINPLKPIPALIAIGIILVAIALALFTGCGSLIPQEHTQKDAIKGATAINASQSVSAVRTAENTQMPTASVEIDLPNTNAASGKVRVNLGPQSFHSEGNTASDQGTDTHQEMKLSSTQSIPLFVKIIGLCIAVVMVAFLVRFGVQYLTTQFPALRTIFGVAHLKTEQEVQAVADGLKHSQDQELAKEIAVVEAQCAACTDTTKQVELNASLARLQKARGKLSAS